MQKRFLGLFNAALAKPFHSFLTLSLAATAFILLLRGPFLRGAEDPLQPSDQFGTPLADPFHALDVRPTPSGHLLYLYSSTGGGEIVEQDAHGAITRTVAFSNDIPAHALAVSADGRFAVLQSSRRGGRILLFDSNGSMEQTIMLPAETLASRLFYLGNRLLMLRDDNDMIADPLAPTESGPYLSRGPHLGLSLNPTSSVILDEAADTISVFHADQPHKSYKVQLVAPELQAILANNRQENRGPDYFEHTVFDASVNVHNELFVGLTRIPLRTGSLILRFDVLTGALHNRYRCALPAIPSARTAGNPEGHMLPNWLSVTNNSLFLVSSRERMVARYAID